MNRFTTVAMTMAALTGPAAAADFEGRAEYQLTGSRDQHGSAVALLGPEGVRFQLEFSSPELTQMGMPGMKAITLVKAGDRSHVYSIDEAHHTYSVIETDPQAKTGSWKVTKLGPATVAGYACQRARVESEGSRAAEVCISTTLGRVPFWIVRGEGDGGVTSALARAGLDGLPIRWAANAGGNGEFVLELVKATRESVPASTFDVPAGYTQRKGGPALAAPDLRARMEEGLKQLTPDQRRGLQGLLRGKGTGSGQ